MKLRVILLLPFWPWNAARGRGAKQQKPCDIWISILKSVNLRSPATMMLDPHHSISPPSLYRLPGGLIRRLWSLASQLDLPTLTSDHPARSAGAPPVAFASLWPMRFSPEQPGHYEVQVELLGPPHETPGGAGHGDEAMGFCHHGHGGLDMLGRTLVPCFVT